MGKQASGNDGKQPRDVTRVPVVTHGPVVAVEVRGGGRVVVVLLHLGQPSEIKVNPAHGYELILRENQAIADGALARAALAAQQVQQKRGG